MPLPWHRHGVIMDYHGFAMEDRGIVMGNYGILSRMSMALPHVFP